MQYYDLKKNWRKVKPHLENPKVKDTLVRDFNKFTYGRWRKEFTPDKVPHDFESCDWWLNHRGRMPAFWNYVKHSACHWLVNSNLELAQLVKPKEEWHILTSAKHSTVWNMHNLLFDFNFLALGTPPDECFQLADEELLAVGAHLELGYASHYIFDIDEEHRGKFIGKEELLKIEAGLDTIIT